MLTLAKAETIVTAALEKARALDLKPVAVVVLDARGAVKCTKAEDGTSLRRVDIATGKAHGALALGVNSRALGERALKEPHFIAAATHAVGGSLIPLPGGVLIQDAGGEIIGAVGISGDTSDNDETAALAGIETAGLKAVG
jgi:uncharacterized protein GlcG (DUF336 family)